MDTKTTLLSTLPIVIILASLGAAVIFFPQNQDINSRASNPTDSVTPYSLPLIEEEKESPSTAREEVRPTTITITVACSSPYQPVCGTNNLTYESVCEAQRAGTQIAHVSTCESTQATPTSTPLPEAF